jgi:hypothetical protein
MSPLVNTVKGYRISVYSNDHPPPHVHVRKGDKVAKVTLSPVQILSNRGFMESELREIIDIVRDNKGHSWKIWHEVHGEG